MKRLRWPRKRNGLRVKLHLLKAPLQRIDMRPDVPLSSHALTPQEPGRPLEERRDEQQECCGHQELSGRVEGFAEKGAREGVL